jgi:hypothetical protein|tara:strand:- start:641 stop:1294 length:654 start_codon:yes stop_codon:yes gene_type:complete
MSKQNLIEQYGLKKEQIGFSLALIVFFLFLTYSTQPVPNKINDTILYKVDSNVPPNYVSGTQAGLGIFLVILLVASFRMKDIQKGRVSERKFKEVITEEIKIKQTKPLPNDKFELPEGDFTIDKNVFTLWEYRGEESRIPLQYIVQAKIREKDGSENYYLITGSPTSLMIDDIVEVDEPLEYVDKCPDCNGRFPNREVITVQDLDKYKKIKKAVSSE